MPTDGEWSRISGDKGLRPGERAVVALDGEQVLVIRTMERTYAMSNRCPHLGCGLSKGRLEGDTLICPCHDWSFDIRDGRFTSAPEIRLDTYDCRMEGNEIWLRRRGKGR